MNLSRNLRIIFAMLIAVLAFSIMAVPASAQDATATPIVIVITATPSPSAVAGQAQIIVAPKCPNYVVVRPGDDLYRIALAAGTSWPILQTLNGIANPNLIYIGQVICLPTGANVVPAATATAAAGTATQNFDATATINAATIAAGTPIPLSTNTPTAAAPTPMPTTGAVIFPAIALNTYKAASGDTLVITGVSFPPSSPLDVYLNPYGAQLGAPVASVTSAGDGSLSVNFTIPNGADGNPLKGPFYTITVKARTTGYYGYTTYTNTKP